MSEQLNYIKTRLTRRTVKSVLSALTTNTGSSGGGGGTVESVTGDGVDNTDPNNPVLSFPTPAEIGALSGSGTTNEIAYFTAPTTLASLPVSTYPNLTELSYVKGVTSPIQTASVGSTLFLYYNFY